MDEYYFEVEFYGENEKEVTAYLRRNEETLPVRIAYISVQCGFGGWGYPEFVGNLARKFKTVDFVCKYANQNWEQEDCGAIVYRNGERYKEFNGGQTLAIDMWNDWSDYLDEI